MKCILQLGNQHITIDLQNKIPCFFSLVNGENNPRCFYLPYPSYEPFRIGSFVGSIKEGGAANCMVVTVAPHGSGTHTECIGHIAKGDYSISNTLTTSFFLGYYSKVGINSVDEDSVISHSEMKAILSELPKGTSALALNVYGNFNADNSGSNPAYFLAETMELIVKYGIEHLIVNIPSVDKEEDGGILAAHHTFWNYKRSGSPRFGATITELATFPEDLEAGSYIVEIQIAPIHSDASPSRIFLYPIEDFATTDSK